MSVIKTYKVNSITNIFYAKVLIVISNEKVLGTLN